jgi:hypothetical protein
MLTNICLLDNSKNKYTWTEFYNEVRICISVYCTPGLVHTESQSLRPGQSMPGLVWPGWPIVIFDHLALSVPCCFKLLSHTVAPTVYIRFMILYNRKLIRLSKSVPGILLTRVNSSSSIRNCHVRIGGVLNPVTTSTESCSDQVETFSVASLILNLEN